MKTSQTRTLQAFERVQTFLDANSTLLGTIPQSKPRTTLDSVVAGFNSVAAAQGSNKVSNKGMTNQTQALRTALIVKHMRPIAAIAKDQATQIPQTPPFKMPSGKITVGLLVAAATAMAQASQPYEQTFIAEGLPTDFIAQLNAAATAVQSAFNVQGTTKAAVVNGTTNLTTLEEQGRRSLNILNRLVIGALTGNKPKLAEWANLKRIAPKPPTSKSSTTATGSTTSGAPAATPSASASSASKAAATPAKAPASATTPNTAASVAGSSAAAPSTAASSTTATPPATSSTPAPAVT